MQLPLPAQEQGPGYDVMDYQRRRRKARDVELYADVPEEPDYLGRYQHRLLVKDAYAALFAGWNLGAELPQ